MQERKHTVMYLKQLVHNIRSMPILWGSLICAVGLHVCFFLAVCVLMPEEYYHLGSTRSTCSRPSLHTAHTAHGAHGTRTYNGKITAQQRATFPNTVVPSTCASGARVDELRAYLPAELQAVFKKYNLDAPQKTPTVHKKKKIRKKALRKKIGTVMHRTQKTVNPVGKKDREKPKPPPRNKKKVGRFVIADTPPKFTTKTESSERTPSKAPEELPRKEDKQPASTVRTAETLTQSITDAVPSPAPTPEHSSVKETTGIRHEESDVHAPEDGDSGDSICENGSMNGNETEEDAVFSGDYVELNGSVETTGGLAGEYQKSEAAKLGEYLNNAWRTPAGCQDTPPVEIEATVKHDGTLAIDVMRSSSVPIKNYAARRFLSTIPTPLLKPVAGLKIKFTFL